MEFRRRMMEGDKTALSGLHWGTQTTVAEVMKTLGKIPPLDVLHLCNRKLGDYVKDHLLQHGDDLDFVQDVLSATGGCSTLNPVLNGVLAGFTRRKTYGRFKCGQLNLDFDRLRYANTVTEKDNDLQAVEVVRNNQTSAQTSGFRGICKFYQQPAGCRYGTKCTFLHKCVICNDGNHGAKACGVRRDPNTGERRLEATAAGARDDALQDRPPNPRFRRARANGNRR